MRLYICTFQLYAAQYLKIEFCSAHLMFLHVNSRLSEYALAILMESVYGIPYLRTGCLVAILAVT